jgi:hypothetical protein
MRWAVSEVRVPWRADWDSWFIEIMKAAGRAAETGETPGLVISGQYMLDRKARIYTFDIEGEDFEVDEDEL